MASAGKKVIAEAKSFIVDDGGYLVHNCTGMLQGLIPIKPITTLLPLSVLPARRRKTLSFILRSQSLIRSLLHSSHISSLDWKGVNVTAE